MCSLSHVKLQVLLSKIPEKLEFASDTDCDAIIVMISRFTQSALLCEKKRQQECIAEGSTHTIDTFLPSVSDSEQLLTCKRGREISSSASAISVTAVSTPEHLHVDDSVFYAGFSSLLELSDIDIDEEFMGLR
jgi:hypothetical protein